MASSSMQVAERHTSIQVPALLDSVLQASFTVPRSLGLFCSRHGNTTDGDQLGKQVDLQPNISSQCCG